MTAIETFIERGLHLILVCKKDKITPDQSAIEGSMHAGRQSGRQVVIDAEVLIIESLARVLPFDPPTVMHDSHTDL